MNKKTLSNWDFPACNMCNSSMFVTKWDDVTTWEHEGSFRIVQCNRCGLAYTYPRPSMQQIGKYYPAESYWGRDVQKKLTDGSWKLERSNSYQYLYNLIFNKKNTGSILDIGAGTGLFLSKFKELSWKTFGIEFSKEAVKFAKKAFSVEMKSGDFLEHSFQRRSFDVVTLNNALEHVYQPLETLKAIKTVLKDNGILVITVPNSDSLGARIFGKQWYAVQPPRHLYHFSEQTLSLMLTKAGFKVISFHRWYWIHNYFTFFESIRIKNSPRFVKKNTGGLAVKQQVSSISILGEIKKIAAKIIASSAVLLGSIMHKSEVITVIAIKQ